MASTSDPPAAGEGTDGSVATATAVSRPSEPPPSPSSYSKRRWSPCTWRYAIEEVQPDLGSRPRSASTNAPHSSSSLRTFVSSDHAALPASRKSRPLDSQNHATYSKYGEKTVRRSVHANRPWLASELSELRARPAQSRTYDVLMTKEKRPAYPHQPNPQKEPARESNKEEQDDNKDEFDEDADDAELGHHSEGREKRKRREMSPSELYFCHICREKAVEASKQSSSSDRPLPPQGS